MSAMPPQPNGAGPHGGAEFSQYLTFMLGGETFAIGILAIKEIIEYHDLTLVPMMPACVRGVINLRGAVVPVMDMQTRFGREPSPITKRTCIVIVELEAADGGRQVVGVVVDGVNEVLEIASSDIEPPPAFGAGLRSDFIAGVGKVRGRFVILLAVGQVLSLEGLEAARESAGDGASRPPAMLEAESRA
jgi:purine-binding chemotaxis protein CheW